MTSPIHEGLLAPSDIADLAGVSRAAVSNWRRRMDDFPKQAGGTPGKPLFASKAIEAWLEAHPEKRKSAPDSESRVWESQLWGVANQFRGYAGSHDFSELVLRVAVDVLEGRTSLATDRVNQQSIDALREALEGIPREGLAKAVDSLLERTSRALGKAGAESGFIGSRTSTLLASLAATIEGGTLYDPACGIGVALLQARDLGATPDRIVGHEINHSAAEIARDRAALHGVDLEVLTGDVLQNDLDPDLVADVIIAEPPFGMRLDADAAKLDPRLRFGIPPRMSGESYWLQHVVAHLAPGGVGYVLTSPGVLFRGGPEAEIRRKLLLGGWVRAVVGLAGRMLPHTMIAPALWVLNEEKLSVRGEVLLIDASQVAEPENEVAGWLADEATLADVPHVKVAIDELAVGNVDLSPARWILPEEVDGAQLIAEFDLASAELLQLSGDLPVAVQQIETPTIEGQSPVLTVSALVEAGVVEVAPARPSRQGSPEFEDRRVDATAVRTRELAPIQGEVHDEYGVLTQPGDVLLTTIDKVRAIVDEDGGHFPVGTISRIRVIDLTKLDPHYLADILSGEWNLRLATGAAIQRIPVRDIEIPVPSLEDQRVIHRAVTKAREAKQLAAEAAQAADNLTTVILNSVRHGVPLASSSTEGPTR